MAKALLMMEVYPLTNGKVVRSRSLGFLTASRAATSPRAKVSAPTRCPSRS